MILALEVCGFGKAIGVGARPGRRPSFPDKAWATWCPLLARGPPAPAPKWPHSQHPGGLLPPATLPLPTYLSAQGLGDILLPPSPRPKHTQLSRESPRSPLSPLPRACVGVCVCGGEGWCALAAQRPQAITVQPLRDLQCLGCWPGLVGLG